MATLDQLSADRRAIIELVLQRGQSYEDLSGALGMPEGRVREHAREALASLAPRTAERVDPQWRGQVADYVLGQQSGPQAKATRSHLKASEPARAWALSVLDSVGHLYPNGAEPAIPSAGRGSDGDRGGGAAAGGAVAGATGGSAAAGAAGDGGGARAATSRERRPLSDAARAHVKRRRIAAAVAGALVIVAAVLLITGVFGGDEPAEDEAADTAATAEPEVLAQIALEPVGGSNGAGAAIIAQREGQTVLLTQGQLPPPGNDEAYIAWLYNSPEDSVAVAGPQVDRRGNFQAVGPLPEDYERYESLDISVQRRGVQSDRRNHSGESVLRGPLEGTPELTGEAPPGGTLTAPEGTAPPSGGSLPDPGSLPTVPEG